MQKRAEGNEHGVCLDAKHFENAHLEWKHSLSCSYMCILEVSMHSQPNARHWQSA